MSSRARSLWWKEWRQLRMLRAGGALMIVVAPVMLLSAAEASKRGWVPLGALQGYSASTVVQDALPMFLGFLIWPLLALLFAAQSYCGDVAAGTEWFWMERPVQPRRIWTTRLLASLSSLGAVIVLHWIVWLFLVAVWGKPGSFDEVGVHARWFLMGDFSLNDGSTSMWIGLFAAAAAFVATLAASALARSPMQALPLGLILVALPLGLGLMLGGLFPHALVGGINMVTVVPMLLFVAYVIASYRSSCRGEPAGRGRLVRGLSVLGVGMVAVVALGAPAGFWLTARAEVMALASSNVVASPAGDRFFIFNDRQYSGWLFDIDSGDELLHLQPYVTNAAWSATGDRLAVMRISATSGFVLDIYDRDGTALVENLDCERCIDISWAGERLAVSTFEDGAWRLDWLDPATGERTAVEVGPSVVPLKLVGPSQSGASYVARQTRVAGKPGDRSPDGRGVILLYGLDVTAGRIGEPVSIEGIDGFYRFGSVAPDSSAVLLKRASESAVVDISNGSARELGMGPAWALAWLQPNRPVWAKSDGEDLSILIDEEGAVREFGHFDGHGMADLLSSPDGKRLLLVRYPYANSPAGVQTLQHWLYDVETESWTALEQTLLNDRHGWSTRAEWVNNDTIVLRGAGVLALCDPGVPGSLRYIKG